MDDPEIQKRKKNSAEITAIPVECGREGEGVDDPDPDPEIEERNNGSADVSAGVVHSGREQEAPKVRKTKTKLAQELSSDTSDEDYEACPMPSVLPGTPRKAKQSFMTSQKEPASVTPVDKEGPSQEATEGNVDDGVHSQHDEGAGRDDETSDESTSETSSDEGSSDEDYEESESSELEANSARQQTWKQFYREGHAKSLKDTLLVKFCKHLQDILGGCKKESLAIEHAQNIRRVWDMINPDDDTLASLLDDGGLNIWRKWAKPLLDAKKVRPGTIRASLTSLNKFFEFIVDQTDNKIKGFPVINSSTIEAIKRVIKRVVAMCSSVNQLYCHEQWEHVLEEVMNAMDPSDFNAMVDTEPAKKALSLLIRSMSEKISQDDAVVVRDFLIARISLENGQRPGPLETARIRDFERIQEKDGKYIMYVSRHKRSKAGPAPITMSSNLKSNLDVYIQYVRVILAKKDEQAIFPTKKNGNAFPAGTIGKRITAWWRKATGKERVTSTRLRKMHSSNLYHQDDAAKRSAHTLMCHTSRTAEKHYMINKLSEAAVEGHRVLAENMGLKETEATVIPASKSPVAENEDIEEDDENEEASRQPSFTDQQRDDIDLMFSHVIKTNGPLSMEQTRAFMSESVNMVSFVNDPVMVTKVYKRVKYLQGLQMKQGLESLEAVDSKSKISEWLNLSSETSSKQRRRFLWAQEDEEVIINEFMTFQTCPVKAVILDCFKTIPSLKEIAERNGYH